jgi:transcriptional regulator with XRE-family HTH domain
MSGIKSIFLANFYRKLHARARRPRTVEQLAARLYLNRQHLTEVINGTRPGPRTWPRLAKLLTSAELALLGRDSNGVSVPQETLSQLRQCTEAAA